MYTIFIIANSSEALVLGLSHSRAAQRFKLNMLISAVFIIRHFFILKLQAAGGN